MNALPHFVERPATRVAVHPPRICVVTGAVEARSSHSHTTRASQSVRSTIQYFAQRL